MRRLILVTLMLAAAVALVPAAPAGATAPTWPATFRGLTDPQLLPIQFQIEKDPVTGVLGLSEMDVVIDLTCPGIGDGFLGAGFFFYPAMPLDGSRISIDRVEGNMAMHLHARVTAQHVRGTLTMAMAAFDPSEQLIRCDAATQRFAAGRVPDGTAAAAAPRPDINLRIVDRAGRLSFRAVHGTATTRAATRATTRVTYRGKTSAHMPIGFRVVNAPDRRFIDRMDVGAEISCDDGTSWGTWFMGIWWGGGGGPRIVHHRFAMNEVWPDSAFHWSGVVRSDAAHGAFTFAVPAFTQDEQLQRCGSGDLTWTAAPKAG